MRRLRGILAIVLALWVSAGAQTPPSPRLVVIFVIDQMRADYVDRFQGDWTGGLKRLVSQGAWFRNAAYPYVNTVTCVGHATIATGTLPRTHGIIQNAWWDRDSKSQVSCTADRNAKSVVYGGAAGGGDSAFRLAVPTFTDLLRTQKAGRVVALSLKDRSAIMLAGHGGSAVTWLNPGGDRWMTSSAFATSPVPEVRTFIDAHPMTADYGKSWTRMLPADRYPEPDDAEGETPPGGWRRIFPHLLNGTGNGPDAAYRSQWQRSPYANAYLGEFAASLVQSFELGKRPAATDVLAVSFSTPDLVGHGFGPRSQEIRDIYAQLDLTVGKLLDELDAFVGKGQYVVAVSADHGVTEIPEQIVTAGRDGGRLSAVTLAALIDSRASAALGEGRYVSRLNGNDVYFEPGMYDRVASNAGAIRSIAEGLRTTKGVAAVFTADQLRSGAASADPALKAAALSYYPGRSGDLVLAMKPGWMLLANGTTHGSGNPDDQRVPIVLYGPGIRPGTYPDAATPADIAPTLAFLTGVTMTKVDGQVLKSALAAR